MEELAEATKAKWLLVICEACGPFTAYFYWIAERTPPPSVGRDGVNDHKGS